MSKLVDKAKSLEGRPGRTYIRSDEELDLAIAWLRGDVTNSQVVKTMGMTSVVKTMGMTSNTVLYSWIAVSLCQAYDKGKIKV